MNHGRTTSPRENGPSGSTPPPSAEGVEFVKPEDEDYFLDGLIRAGERVVKEFMKAQEGKTHREVDEEYARRYPELKHNRAALSEKYREDHGGKEPWEVVEAYKKAHPEQFPDE